MRLHHLTATAFGPFAGTVDVDFDDLGAAGLFLLTGPTGAGKSSVLDAVCFALYGDVPGDRSGARHLRSDHAGPDDEPRVVLTFSVGDRRLRLSRSPAWDRPKRRGTGTRRIQAAVVAEELRDGAWEAVSTRLDETGQLVGELLGMTSTQFTQVAMLPQGRFQTFLRASSAERHDVLKRLFRTRRYDDVEHWLAGQRREAQRASALDLARCAALLDRLGEATAADLPGTDLTDLTGGPAVSSSTAVLESLPGDALEAWLDDQSDRVGRDLAAAREDEAVATTAVTTLRTRLQTQEALLRERRRGEEAQLRVAALDDAGDRVARARRRLGDDAAARPVLPHARRHQGAVAGLGRAEDELHRARAAAGHLLDDEATSIDSVDLRGALDDAVRRHGEARGWLPREAELSALHDRAAGLRREGDELEHAAVALAHEVDRLRGEVRGRESARETLVGVAATVPALTAEADRAADGEHAAREAAAARDELREVVAVQQELAETALRLRSAHLDAKQARIDGAAAELASQLAAGCSCPVCGSVEHPSPAPRATAVGQVVEDEALVAFESAETARLAADEGVAAVRARLAAWEARSSGHDAEGWAAARAHADDAVAAARRDVARLERVDAELQRLQPSLDRATTALGTARSGAQERAAAAAELDEQAEQLEHRLADLLDPSGAASVTALLADLTERRRHLERLLDLGRAVDEATAVVRQATAATDDAVAEAGFDDLAQCLAAVLDDDAAGRLRGEVERWERERAEAVHVLADPEVLTALAADEPPVVSTRSDLVGASDLHEEAAGRRRAAEHRQQRVTVLVADLRAALETWLPRRERHRLLASLSGLVEGTSADNRLRMRLTGYVLAERLRQVVAAANVRLAAMTDERFALEHAEEKGAGEQRGGLSLRVRDDWSGTRRDPATLSGGETFVVSLALALGLADTVAHEAGGAAVETLFVDEGFGALDSDTLDAVMDVLDGLRDGGRVVGLVSHVAELRARVPTQLEVRKGRHGSTVTRAVHRA